MLIFAGWVPQDLCSSHVRCLKSGAPVRGRVLRRRIAELCARAGTARAASPAATGCERTDRTNAGRIRNVLDVELEGLPLAEWDMRELRRRHAAELVAKMLTDQGRSPGGARNILRSLSAMTEDAITDEVCELKPLASRDGARRRPTGE